MVTARAIRRKPPRFRRRPPQTQTRVVVMGLLIVLAFLGLSARLWYLQIFLGDELRQQSIDNSTRIIPTRAPRGDIVDRRGAPLADSRQSLSLDIDANYKK